MPPAPAASESGATGLAADLGGEDVAHVEEQKKEKPADKEEPAGPKPDDEDKKDQEDDKGSQGSKKGPDSSKKRKTRKSQE